MAGYFEENVYQEDVPELKRYKPYTFSGVIESDRRQRKEAIDRNLERIEEARRKDMDLNAKMMILDRIENMVDSLVGAIDRYSEVQACKHPITINVNAPFIEEDRVRDAVVRALKASYKAMDDVNGPDAPIKYNKE